jgi:hypothetical protein
MAIRRDDLRQVEEASEEARKAYFAAREEHDALIEELNKAKAIIAQLQRSSFLEKSEHKTILAQIQDHSKDALTRIPNGPKRSIFSFIMTMAQQVGVQADQDLVKKVTNIID